MIANIINLTRDKDTEADARRASEGKGHVTIEDVAVVFGSGSDSHTAVESTTLDVQPGEFLCILGPSGCGKSTLLNSVAGFVQPTAGAVKVDGKAVTQPGPDRGMVFQQYSLMPWKTVRDNVAFGPLLAGHSRSEAQSIAYTFLNMVGLSRFAKHYPSELSGGMQQRVGIARALANYPSVLLMDEPFGALDAQTRLMMQENLLRIWEDFGTTVMFVTHDVDEAVFLADRVVIMSAAPGRIIDDFKVDIARPRTPEVYTDETFVALKRRCMERIRSESLRAFDQQNH
ncbi:ABC transporter ATP-binding protein [Thalassospiraceae bacterium LMO-SO8]|nr:ABC transporter ATP-binding protein [Alphaproteobacteria bacterium LMO-S08]WND77166.1 ABC transporter ATP-binding protein [Thalassospiraceae bacterium LMO-SO8]